MVMTEYSQRLILKYFTRAVCELKNECLELDFGFHAFGPFIKLTRNRAAAPGAKFFVLVVIVIVLVVLLLFQQKRRSPLTPPPLPMPPP